MDNNYDKKEKGSINEKLKKDFKDKDLKQRKEDLDHLFLASQARESSHPQFDAMSYSRYNESNEMADMSYLAPKKNKGDSRITTGITHEKDSSLVSFFLNMNFEGNVRVFKGDRELYDLGTALTKLVRKSRELEEYDDKRMTLYRNFVVQGTAFAIEEYVEELTPNKKILGEVDFKNLENTKWKEEGKNIKNQGCRTELVDGKKVFLQDIRQKTMTYQPKAFIVDYITREQAEAVWGTNRNWKCISETINTTAATLGSISQGSIYSDWVLNQVDQTKVERIRVYDQYKQRYQVYLNGIPMLPCEFPLQIISPKGVIPIAKGDIDPMNLFAYSKSEPAKTKIDQAVFDEILQNMIKKFRQGTDPTMVNNTGKILAPDMFLAGKIITGVDPDTLTPLFKERGLTNIDFSFYRLFEEQIGKKTLSSLLEGNPEGGQMTLGQYMDMQKKQMLKIGGKIDGLIQWEKQMLKLRTYNLLVNGFRKNDKGAYPDITSFDSLSSGSKGTNIFKFGEKLDMTSEDVFNEQVEYEKNYGVEADITYLNPKLLREILNNPEYYLLFEVIPVDKNNDKLTQMMFVQMITEAKGLFGDDSLQVEKLKKQYASLMGKSFDEIFLTEQELELLQQERMMNQQVNPQEEKQRQMTSGQMLDKSQKTRQRDELSPKEVLFK